MVSIGVLAAVIAGAPSVSAVPNFSAPGRVPGASGYEPGIDIASDGTIYVNEPTGRTLGSSIWRSTNGGGTFQLMEFGNTNRRLPGGFDSDVQVGRDGRVYFLDLWIGSNLIMSSGDRGETWTDGQMLSTLGASDRQWLAIGPKDSETGLDTLYIVYALIQPPAWTMVARSTDGGVTWTHHSVAPGVNESIGYTGQIVADDSGFVAFTFVEGGKLYLARSFDRAETWEKIGPVNHIGEYVLEVDGGIQGLALDGTALHTVWTDHATHSLWYSKSEDYGRTWADQLLISDEGSAVFPWVDARNGKVAISWYGADVSPAAAPDDVPESTQWFIRYAESSDNGATFTPRINVQSNPVKTNFICTQGLSCTDGRELGDFQQVAIDTEGRSLVVYGDARLGRTSVARQL